MLTKLMNLLQINSYIPIEPNLPKSRVTVVLIGKKYKSIENSLLKHNIWPIYLDKNARLPQYLVFHADLQVFHYSKNELYCENDNIIRKIRSLEKFDDKIKIYKLKGDINKGYPDCCLYNQVRIGNKLICNKSIISNEILEKAKNDGLTIIHVNQGFVKCSICPISEKAIITDDLSIYKSAQNFFDDVLLISKDSIRLEGFNYGFIGGCTGLIAKNKLAFTGAVESHKDYKKILDLLSKYSIEPVELSNEQLFDVGSILPLFQEFQ